MLDSLAPARRRLVVAAAGLTVLGVVGVVGVVALAVLDRRPVQPVAQDQPGPVLLVSGYGGATTSLDPLREALGAAGRTVVVVPPTGRGTGDLDAQAAALGQTVDRVLAETGAPSVDVVGYSAGGVVARLWVRSHGGAGQARRVLTVGSPHHGTEVAALAVDAAGCPPACQQLSPDSAVLQRLNRGDETPDGPVFVSVWSELDQVVSPPASAALAGALDLSVQSVCAQDRASHGALPADPVVLALLDSALGVDPPTVPTGVACG